jgi:hypothetical protein
MLDDYASHNSEASGSPFCWDLAARRGLGRLGRFIGAGSLCDQSGGQSGRRLGSEPSQTRDSTERS